ncbi:hypothetical protein [Marinomonas sp. GJ51-6]|uniref:hypothetical protein n=1 Tax=Marinomonas sp. GJ51-6 TaxID=2992802 RepID=UPI002934B19D|nr:hypothetical protein [Marinomonas sp. GJ51-6]WOD08706.1 hypothetical protein ONZ50_06390 [Marinomonas sp. GJ51-6]
MSAFVVYNLELDGQGGATALTDSDLPKSLPDHGCRWVHLDGLGEEAESGCPLWKACLKPLLKPCLQKKLDHELLEWAKVYC